MSAPNSQTPRSCHAIFTRYSNSSHVIFNRCLRTPEIVWLQKTGSADLSDVRRILGINAALLVS